MGFNATSIAAVLAWLSGLGFGLPGVYGLWHFAKNRVVWTFMGFPTYGGGPFEKIGLHTSVPLLAGFVVVCLAELVVGGMLWAGQPAGLWLALALLPFELAYWIGFALPFGPIIGVLRTVLVIAAIRAG
ncbi:MAG: hypothetical protein KIS88_08635 [Anaerolineales bacterium]|nr:hypothetical protein [Anaerolineales bacterium]